MEYLSEKYGLITDEDLTPENGQLYLVENLFLLYYKFNKKADIISPLYTMKTQLKNSFTGISGLYHRNPDLIDRRIMSHDNIIAIMCYSKYFDTPHRFEIWEYLLKHLGTYDNSQGKTDQLSRFLPYSPQTLFVLGLCADSKLIYTVFPILYPWFALNIWFDCLLPAKDSDAKILDWITFFALKKLWFMKPLNNYFEKKMKEQYGEDYIVNLMKTFHGNNSKEFPINKLLGIGV